MQAWRLFRARFRSTAFNGVGGLYVASRWNQQGVEMVYTATSRALAAIEFFVNLQPNDAADDLLLGEATIPDSLIEQLNVDSLPPGWRELNNLSCRDIGTDWVTSGRSVALQVPSAVVDEDWNVLLNPRHTEFTKVQIGTPKPFRFDPRMYR
jgi:RES domain-containing protein